MWKTLLTDGVNGSMSSKRVVTIAAFLLCATAFIANLFYDLEIDQFIYDSMMYIVVSGLAMTASEKFAPQSKKE